MTAVRRYNTGLADPLLDAIPPADIVWPVGLAPSHDWNPQLLSGEVGSEVLSVPDSIAGGVPITNASIGMKLRRSGLYQYLESTGVSGSLGATLTSTPGTLRTHIIYGRANAGDVVTGRGVIFNMGAGGQLSQIDSNDVLGNNPTTGPITATRGAWHQYWTQIPSSSATPGLIGIDGTSIPYSPTDRTTNSINYGSAGAGTHRQFKFARMLAWPTVLSSTDLTTVRGLVAAYYAGLA